MNRALKRQKDKLARKQAAKKKTSVQVGPAIPDAIIADILQKGLQAHRSGNLQEAEKNYRQVLENRPDQDEANHLLGLVALQYGNLDAAIQLIKKAIRKTPDKAPYHANLGSALHKKGRLDDAVKSCMKAIQLDSEYAEGHANLAAIKQQQGKLDEAIVSFRKAIAIDQNFSEAHNNLGNTLKQQGNLDEALDCYRLALSINPNDVEAHYNIGLVLQEKGLFDEAANSYRDALRIAPDFIYAHYSLGNLFEKTSDLEKADYHIRQVLLAYPEHPGANVIQAIILRRTGETAAAIEMLEALPHSKLQGVDSYRVHFELGKLYDLEKNSNLAFKHFSLANKAQGKQAGRQATVQAANYREFVKNTARHLTRELANEITSGQSATIEKTPVFLVGFPRSGTTLLDQILDGHPRLQVMEENPSMTVAREIVDDMPAGYPDALKVLGEEEAQHLRDIYWKHVEGFMSLQVDTILIDKLPLNITNIPLIMRLFPDARFILALRHPLDVVLSNFMQFFQLNDAMSNFLDLEDTGRLYQMVMNLWLQCAETFELPFHTTKYENLVADLEGEARGLLNFLDVEWDDKILDYQSHARSRGIINTPSYAQVMEPVYKRAAYRWKRYENQLKPVATELESLINAFGYE